MYVLLSLIQSTVEEEKNEAIREWRGIVEQILGILLRVFSTELRDTYLTTVIEQVSFHVSFAPHSTLRLINLIK
jgi:hypothetical protein